MYKRGHPSPIIWSLLSEMKTKFKTMRICVKHGQYHTMMEIFGGSLSLISGIKVVDVKF